MRHTAQVARGRCSSGSCTPSFTTSSCARPSVRCRKPSGSNSGCGVCQNASTITCCVTCAARAPWACPPMPSTTSSRAAFSATATATRSWFSSRPAEGELRARLALQLRRGKVDCTITYRRPPGPGGALEVDPVALERVLAAVRVVTRSLREPAAALNALDVLRWPGVLREDGGSGEQLLAAAHAV